jgi:hypothetical protein
MANENLSELEDQELDIDSFDEGDLNSPLDRDISLEKADRSLSELKRWYDDGDLIVDPEWQRNYVWNNRQASKLIESFLLNIPVPVVYLAKTVDDEYEVIDGLQRLTSVFKFLDNKFKLVGLDLLTDLNGHDFKKLDKSLQRKLRNSTLRSFELSSGTNTDIHFIVFERLNTGGTKLNDMEIRNCLFRGALNSLIKELAENNNFMLSVSQGSLSKRMNDRALILRFLSFYERTHKKCKQGLKKFLNEFFETYRNPTDQKLDEYRAVFDHCMKSTVSIFGDKAFRLKVASSIKSKTVGEWASRPNAAIFQVIATSFSDYDLGSITRNSDRIYEEYIDLITTDEAWVDNVRRATGETSRLSYVFETWQRRLKEVMSTAEENDAQRAFSRNLKRELFGQASTCINRSESIGSLFLNLPKYTLYLTCGRNS